MKASKYKELRKLSILFLGTLSCDCFQIKVHLGLKSQLIGTIAFALSGLLIAFREKTTLFGAIILAICLR